MVPIATAPKSAFAAFGLSTQAVSEVLEDDVDLTDEEEEDDKSYVMADLQELVGGSAELSDSDTFGSDADFG